MVKPNQMAAHTTPEKLPLQTRFFGVRSADMDKEKRTVSLSFSSEEPVERRTFFGNYREILSHDRGAVKLDRLKNGAPLLRNHDPDQIVGVVESARVSDGKGEATVRFASNAAGADAFALVSEDVLRNVSVGYIVHRYQITEGKDKEPDEYRAIDWEPVEISLVAVPADPTVGVGRSLETREYPIQFERSIPNPQEGSKKMSTPAVVPEVEVNQVRQAAAEAETKRVRNIGALCAKYRDHVTADEQAKWIHDNTEERDVLVAIQDKIIKRYQPVAGSAAEVVDLSTKEKQQYSIVRGLRAQLNREKCFEVEVSLAIAKALGREAQGLLVPTSLPTFRLTDEQIQKRAPLTAGTNLAGGYTVETDVQPLIDILRNKIVARRMGARVLTGLNGNLLFPKQITAGAAVWQAENPGSDVAETDVTFGSFTLSPKNVMAMQSYSRQLLAQSTLDVEALVRNDLMAVIALAIDLAVINGSGASNQPLGILGQAGLDVVAYGTNGLQPTYGLILQHETDVATANADIGSLGYVTTPGIRGRLKQTAVMSNTIGLPIWSNDRRVDGGLSMGEVNGYPALASNQVPSTFTKGSSSGICHAVIFGDWSSVLIGEWGALELLADPYTKGGQGMVRIIGYALCDTNVRYVSAFSVSKDALP